MTARYWKDLTTEDFAGLDLARQVAILPVGATEQHGPHLPLGTDSVINEGIVSRAVELVPADIPLLVLPTVAIGVSPEHRDFPGTLTLSAETLLHVVVEIGESVARAGLRKLVLFNSHGGQPAALELAGQRLRTDHGMIVVLVNSWRLMRPADFFPPAEREVGIHAGANETSLLLHLQPGLVRRDRVADRPSAARAYERNHPELAGGGRFRFAWQTQDINPSGAVGDARLATADTGRALTEQASSALVALVTDLSRLPLDVLKSRP